MTKQICHDCGISEGEIHGYGCDMERCPFCGGQLISCNCRYGILELFDDKKYGKDTHFLPPKVYSGGLSTKQRNRWMKILDEKGRVPYILYPNICGRCGELWPEFFKVEDEEWEYYIEKEERGLVLCEKCYLEIRRLINKAKEKHETNN